MTQTEPRQHADAAPIPADPLRAFIDTCLRRKQTPLQIIDAVKDTFGIEMDYGQVIPCWKGEITIPTQTEHRPDADEIVLPTQTAHRQDADEIALPTRTAHGQHADEIALPTQTEHRPDKESVQFAADEPQEPDFTLIADVEAPRRVFELAASPPATQTGRRQDVECWLGGADADDAPATQTGRRQDVESWLGGADADDAPATQTGRRQDVESWQGGADADDAPATQTGRRQDVESWQGGADADDASATQTGRRQNQKTKSVLTDEQKAHIVRGLARYETPTRVAASAQARFGIAIDRRQVYAYDPAGSRPPAQRWIDLHAATRAKFLHAAAEIGVAQKVVRLRMLDRFANSADENNQWERAAAFLAQAAKECGGFYERTARPKGGAAPVAA